MTEKYHIQTWCGSTVIVECDEKTLAVLRGWKRAASAANLGCATTGQLLNELRARAVMDGSIKYRTIDCDR